MANVTFEDGTSINVNENIYSHAFCVWYVFDGEPAKKIGRSRSYKAANKAAAAWLGSHIKDAPDKSGHFEVVGV